ncbi:unnamed protein product [Cunninghamella echinulata]
MGRIQKKGVKGAASNFLTRQQALKKLQISLADFRRICILKGIILVNLVIKRKLTKDFCTKYLLLCQGYQIPFT